MTKTIQAALAPLLIIAFLCGLALFEYPLGRPRLHLTFLYLLITWSLYTYLFYYVIYTSYTAYVYMSWMNISVVFIAIVSIFVSLLRFKCFKELKMCLCKISIVNETLEMLGTSSEYQQLYNWTIRIIIGWIAIICFMNVLDSIWLNYDYSNIARIFAPFVGNYFLHVSTFSDMIWGIILGYINIRFQRINDCIHDLLEESIEDCNNRNKLILLRQRRTEIKKCRPYMWTIMHVHLQLCLISRKLNKIFSIQMVLQMICYFIFFMETTREVNTLYIKWREAPIGQILTIMCICSWTFIFSAKILIFNHICQIVCNKTKDTIAVLYKLSNNNFDEGLREQTLQFILQIKQRELKFSGMGLFYFGYNFVRQFYVSIATIMVITIQMHFTYEYKHIITFQSIDESNQ